MNTGILNTSPLLKQKAYFLEKLSSIVHVSPNRLSTENIQIQIPPFTNKSFALLSSDLLMLVEQAKTFTIEEDQLIYEFSESVNHRTIHINKSIKIYDVSYPEINVNTPINTLRLPSSLLAILRKINDLEFYKFNLTEDGKLIISSLGVVKLEIIQSNLAPHNNNPWKMTFKAKDFLFLNWSNEVVMCMFEAFALFYIFEEDTTTVIKAHGIE
ncbi:hypothetical protein TCON_2230 [Astathelohania contejeani]|uniref:Uncharacterized protein n=1 Tax=Astathelohania contejeani TaxID=164912 RepID=A0ABQ7HWN2_9MICR|nr:hypothetical protein TCON_2230 [Thelohania contejeani]